MPCDISNLLVEVLLVIAGCLQYKYHIQNIFEFTSVYLSVECAADASQCRTAPDIACLH